MCVVFLFFFFFSSRRRHTRYIGDWSSDVCSSDLGFSKTYAMTGWRMGYGVMRQDLAGHIARLMVNSNSCTASFTQMAGVEALRGPQDSVDKMCAEFKKRRDIMVAGLNKIKGFSCRLPKGAFYVFRNVSKTV